MLLEPLHPFEAEQLVAFVVDQVSVALPCAGTWSALAVRETVGAAGEEGGVEVPLVGLKESASVQPELEPSASYAPRCVPVRTLPLKSSSPSSKELNAVRSTAVPLSCPVFGNRSREPIAANGAFSESEAEAYVPVTLFC